MLARASLFLYLGTVLGTAPVIYSDIPCKFSLAAWNVGRRNENSTGAPLVLRQDGAVEDGASYEVTSTYASYPYNVYPTLSLSNGSLRAYRASGTWLTNATAVPSGGPLSWYTSALFNHNAARIYTGVEYDEAGLRVLAAYGIDNMWSLCPFGGALSQTSVVWNVSASGNGSAQQWDFNPGSCWEVRLHLVPVKNDC
ncbi:hypothetical protein K438DRAFT_1687845 [Mycena galopus ATCC 62051]|nr:hypothetical protein K438DRAFT_1732975 [Mycena galopus ATCC 62051]KAF8153519.1 hypothetical protein K438DRAFT_1687845 [Mycena galopus ATCC 62051]